MVLKGIQRLLDRKRRVFEAEHSKMVERFWSTGRIVLEEYTRQEPTCHDEFRWPLELDEKFNITPDQVVTRTLSARDPEQPDKSFLVVQATFTDWLDPEVIADADSCALPRLSAAMIPWFQRVAQECNASRGVIVCLNPSGHLTVYFDGSHFIVIRWAETMEEDFKCVYLWAPRIGLHRCLGVHSE